MRTNTMNTLDLQSSSSPSSVTDSDRAIASCSLQEPIARHTGGDHLPHVSHCSYDIVYLVPDLLDVRSFVLVGFLVSPDDIHFRSTYTVQLRAANAVMKYV